MRDRKCAWQGAPRGATSRLSCGLPPPGRLEAAFCSRSAVSSSQTQRGVSWTNYQSVRFPADLGKVLLAAPTDRRLSRLPESHTRFCSPLHLRCQFSGVTSRERWRERNFSSCFNSVIGTDEILHGRRMLESVRTGLFKLVQIRNGIRDLPSHVWGQGRGLPTSLMASSYKTSADSVGVFSEEENLHIYGDSSVNPHLKFFRMVWNEQ